VARALGTRSRFLIAYLLLAAAVGAALGAFIVLVQRPAPKPPPPWSSWRPAKSSLNVQLFEIAQHVGSDYRLVDGNLLAAVKIDNRTLRSIATSRVLQPKTFNDFTQYDRSSTAIYILCGLGRNCHLARDATSTNGTVLRREALELALYTLEYVHPIDNVLVFFPPAAGDKSVSATLFFHRSKLQSSLEHPLRRTLPRVTQPIPRPIRPDEKKTVDDLTRETYFLYVRTLPVQGYGNMVELLPPS
jgi:hypothetical protein